MQRNDSKRARPAHKQNLLKLISSIGLICGAIALVLKVIEIGGLV